MPPLPPSINIYAPALVGLQVMLGKQDDLLPKLQMIEPANVALATGYHAAMPFIIGLFFGLGASQLLAAYFLSRLQLGRFLAAWCAGLMIASVAVTIQLSIIWTLDGLPSEFFALRIQALAVPVLVLWSNGRHHHLRRKI